MLGALVCFAVVGSLCRLSFTTSYGLVAAPAGLAPLLLATHAWCETTIYPSFAAAATRDPPEAPPERDDDSDSDAPLGLARAAPADAAAPPDDDLAL